MNRKIFISKKMYVAPSISFEELEEEQELLAGSTLEATGEDMPKGEGEGGEVNPAKKSGPFDSESDFVFEIDNVE